MNEEITRRLASVISEVIGPSAEAIDKEGVYPRAGLEALGKAGLLGLTCATEVGGLGLTLRDAAEVVEQVGAACASTGMVLCMHYCGTAVLEKYGPREVREAVAAGRHITTLAFSETGSRSHFWMPLGTAVAAGGSDDVRLDASKSWATSAGEADSYVWSSLPLDAAAAADSPAPSSIWLVPSRLPGLSLPSRFDGLGLRGNSSGPIKAEGVLVPRSALLGADGGGFDLMMGLILPWFQVLSSSCYLGIMEATARKTVAHVSSTSLAHLGQSLRDLPTIRAYVAWMWVKKDMLRGLLRDTLTALESGRDDAQLLVLEIKAAAGEASVEVSDTAMRVCGGAAFRKDIGLERHFRDARAVNVMAPTTDLLYDFIGKTVCGLPLFG